MEDCDQSDVFAANLALFIQHHLSRHGQLATLARALDVEPSRLRRYASSRGSSRELRDIQFLYQLLVALGFDPITVFSAAQRAETLGMLLALAEGQVSHSLSPEFLRLVVPSALDAERVAGRRGPPDRRDLAAGA